MNDDSGLWLKYARENGTVAALALERGLYNPCLQNAQQAVEKALKSIVAGNRSALTRTHSIARLASDVRAIGVDPGLSDDDCDLLDSIYLPSKYPVGSMLPNFEPNEEICRRCLSLAARAVQLAEANQMLRLREAARGQARERTGAE